MSGCPGTPRRCRRFDDLFTKELIVAGTGGATNLYPILTNGILGTKIKMIPGYQGTKQGMLAMERGEVGGNIGITWASLKATTGPWLREGKIKVIIQYGLEKHPELAGVAWIYDYAKTDDGPRRHGPRLRQPGIRPAVHRAAGRAGRGGGDPTHGVRGDDERSGIQGRRAEAGDRSRIHLAAPTSRR